MEKPVLTDDDIESLSNKKFVSDRLDQIIDTFLFCCYTGLSYSDIEKHKPSQIARGIDGNQWIFTFRTKTDVASHIPLLPQAVKLIEKYNMHPLGIAKDVLFPVPSIQKMNEYLKEIAVLCGITKTTTSHVARHTFPTTITLQNGVPIETVSKMLDHTDIRKTQIYAKILDIKVSEDTFRRKQKLHNSERKNLV